MRKNIPKLAALLGIFLPSLGWVFGATIDNSFHSPVFSHSTPSSGVVVLPDDSFLAYNSFSRHEAAGPTAIVKFDASGALVSSFRLSQRYNAVTAIAVAANGQLFIAARQVGKDRRTYARIVKLHADGSRDLSFEPGAGALGTVRGLTIQPDGNILVAGTFTQFNGHARPYLVRLSASGALDENFNSPNLAASGVLFSDPLGIYSDPVLQNDGKILAAGAFTSVGDLQTLCVARFNSDGTPDPNFAGTGYQLVGSSGLPVRTPRALILDADGRVLLGGNFRWSFSGSTPLLRLNSNGSHALSFPPGNGSSSNWGRAILLLPNGNIAAAGSRLHVYQPDGTAAGGYPAINFVPVVSKIALQSSGHILVAGPFPGVLRLTESFQGTDFEAGEFQWDTAPTSVAVRADGRVMVSEVVLHRVDNEPRPGTARLLPDGTLDDSFDPSVRGYQYAGFVLNPDDKLLLFGPHFEAENSFLCERLNPDGSPDASFAVSHDAFADAMLRPNGGYFILNTDSYAILEGRSVQSMLAGGGADPDFALGVDLPTLAVVRTSNGEIERVYNGDNRPLISYPDGRFLFRYFDTSGKYHLVRLNANGSLDSSFAAGEVAALMTSTFYQTISNPKPPYDSGIRPEIMAAAAYIHDVALVADDKIVVVGLFDQYNGTPAPGIVRLLANGNIDPSFEPGAGAQWRTKQVDATHMPEIDSIEVLPDGKMLIAGNFEGYADVDFPGIALLHADGTPDLAFTPPVVLRDFSPFILAPKSKLYPAGTDSFLLTRGYSEPGRKEGRALVRFNILPTTTPALRIHSVNRAADGKMLVEGVGVPGRAHTVEATTNLVFGPWLPAFTVEADGDGNLRFEDAAASGFSTRFHRVAYP